MEPVAAWIARVPGWFVAWLAIAAAVVFADWLRGAGAEVVAATGAAAIGLIVGFSEVLSRYRDAPGRAAWSVPGVLYILFNGAVSLLAFWFILKILPLEADSGSGDRHKVLAQQAILAGLGAMAILRSSIMTARVGTKDVEVGPAAIIEIFRFAMDRTIARQRAIKRATDIQSAMEDVSFRVCYEALTGISLSLLQGASAEERDEVERRVAALASQTGRSDRDKALELGLILADSVGFPALDASVRAIRARNDHKTEDRPRFVAEQMGRLPAEVVLRELAAVCLAANENVRPEQQQILADEIKEIAASDLSKAAMSISVGLRIAAMLGDENLKIGVDLLARDQTP